MNASLAIARREIRSFTQTFSFYVLEAFFLGIAGYFFLANMSFFSINSVQAAAYQHASMKQLNLVEWVLSPFLANVCVLLLLAIPIFSARSFADESKQGTLELLYTYPISDLEILAGKYLALLVLILILISPTFLYFPLASPVKAHFEMNAVMTGYLGLFLLGASFAALGLFVSSLTHNQVVSSGIGFALILFFWPYKVCLLKYQSNRNSNQWNKNHALLEKHHEN